MTRNDFDRLSSEQTHQRTSIGSATDISTATTAVINEDQSPRSDSLPSVDTAAAPEPVYNDTTANKGFSTAVDASIHTTS